MSQPWKKEKEKKKSKPYSCLLAIGVVGVNGWKLDEVGGKDPGGVGVDSSSLWRSLILCKSSFR